MSTYANYSALSVNYDDGRKPNGAHFYLGLIYSLTGKPAQDLYVLDAGCGTGNDVNYMLSHGLGAAAMFDASAAMIERCRKKLNPYLTDGRVFVEQHSLPDIPHPDATFDAVMFNQCLHHLVTLEDDKIKDSLTQPAFPNTIRSALQEAYRVLKPNGVVIINTTAPHQSKEGVWYMPLIPEALAREIRRNSFVCEIQEVMKKIGFHQTDALTLPHDLYMTEEYYYRTDGFMEESWRSSESAIATASKEELEAAAARIRDMKDGGKMEEFMAVSESRRRQVGQYTIYTALK